MYKLGIDIGSTTIKMALVEVSNDHVQSTFERMAAQLPDTTLVRFNRDYPQPYQAGIEHFIPFTEDINRIISQLNHH